jgi:hypothetical protein
MLEAGSAHGNDWRQSYAHVSELSALGCAWEFVRRNPKICEAWSALRPAWQEARGDHGLKIIEAKEYLSAPYLWASSPNADATTASVIWNPAVTGHVLDVVALPPKASFGGQVLDLEFIATEKTLFLAPGGMQQLLLRNGIHSLQLNISGTRITDPVALFVDTAVPEDHPEIQTRLLKCFRKLRTSGALRAECFVPHVYARRAERVLIALDGHLAGVSHREIAVAMFGAARVARDWSDPREHMRDTVRRAISRGLVLMNGGYQMFLR